MIYDEENFPALPDTWDTLTVEEACRNLPVANKVSTKNYLAMGSLPVVDQGAALIGGYTDDDIAVTERLPVIVFGDHTRALKYIDFRFAAGADGIKVLAPNELYLPRSFFRFVQGIRLPDRGYARHFQYLRSSRLPLPPLPEQKRIADKLDAILVRVDACRDRLERVPATLKRFRQSVLASATSGKLTEDWRLRNKLKSNEHIAHDEEEILPEIPGTWTWGRGAELVDPSADIVYGIVQPGPKLNEGVPYVRGMDIENGQILVGQLLKTSKAISDRYSRSALKGGDVLLGIIRATKVAIVPDELNGANITQGTARFRPSSVIRTQYLAAVLESPVTQSWLHAHYRGIDMPGLNLADVRKVPIPLPPIEEQDEIVSRIEELFANAARIEACFITARTKVEKLTPALLAKAFRGELVPQDANDEPAAELLKRVRAMRLNVEAKQPGKTKKLARKGK